jgi:putative nucleotidyltransferase with HDIG domain
MPGMKGEELMRTIRNEHPATEIIIITGNSSVQTAVEGIRSGICDYISKPFDVVEVSSAVSRALGRKQGRSHLVEFLEGVGNVLGKERDSGELLQDLKSSPALRDKLYGAVHGGPPVVSRDESDPQTPQANDSEDDSTLEFLDMLAGALESRDGELRKHSQRVGFYADLLAERMGMDEELREQIRISSFLHDIGKIGLSDQDRERAQLRGSATGIAEEEHPEIGAKLLQPLGFEDSIAEAIRHHHEYWNGDGYPDGLAGEAIPLVARVIAMVDAFDKLVSEQDDDDPLSAKAALAELQKHSGSRFDPALVTAFVGLVDSRDFDLQTDAPAEREGDDS